nr:MAG TPA: VirC1 protein [Inoviridae sp.]
MIYFYSGTPGSGKSLSMAKQVEFWLKVLGKNVIDDLFL